MKKTFILALVATLALTGSVFAQSRHHATAEATFAFGVGGAAAGPTTTNNDDSCDIGTTPAATLLLPYFEVETATRGVDTFFTVINTGYLPQIAHVVLWTDWSFPVLDFNLFLTGYDVQAISLYDIIVNGIVAPTNANLTTGGTSSATTPGSVSAANNANPNLNIANCGAGLLPGILSPALRTAVQQALVTGLYQLAGFSCGTTQVGSSASAHRTSTTAIGYVTIDTAALCSTTLPNDPSYFAREILFDNVLTGDYETLDKTAGNNYAGGNPLVHIRAIPEGGPAGVPLTGNQTNFPYTFYSRFINGQTVTSTGLTYTGTLSNYDRRQPLPQTFAARYIQGGATSFNTDYKIWREGRTGPVVCTTPPSLNSTMTVAEIVRFDEHENPMTFAQGQIVSPLPSSTVILPETSRTSTTNTSVFPVLNSPAGDTAGWMYLNLNSGTTTGGVNVALHPNFGPRPSQNWVVISMTGAGSTAGLFGVEFDATWLGNGCSPAAAGSTANGGTVPIGPAGGILVCPLGDPGCVPGAGLYTGTNTTP